jgi:N-acetylglucosaminyldiphosphoundecaprenol N-acetyl-beta-D-mannosaminyltransferase
MPLVWLGKIYGFSNISRVYGPDLMMELCRRSVPNKLTHFLYGGDTGVAEQLRKRLEKQFPGIRVVGTYTPPFRPLNQEEEQDLEKQVRATRPDLFWVGLSTPKQEYFMATYLPRLEAKVMIGVGAAFDIHTGRARDAPRWVKVIGMQWLHRLCQEPRRLWKRYLYNNPIFIYKITKQLLRDGFRLRKED